MKFRLSRLLAVSAVAATTAFTGAMSSVASAQDQFIPILSYRVGAYASGGSGFFGGVIDYFNLVNATGGINGVKLSWEECETEYNASRGVECYERLKKKNGGAGLVEPLGTGIAYIWNQTIVRAWGPTRASTVTYITPVVGVTLGVIVLGEHLSWNEPVGALIVFVGILLAQNRIRLGRH